jgi:hypothetical protein
MESLLEKAGLLLKPEANEKSVPHQMDPNDPAMIQKFKDEQLILLHYLTEIEKLKETDPVRFSAALKELGIVDESESKPGSTSSTDQIASLRFSYAII